MSADSMLVERSPVLAPFREPEGIKPSTSTVSLAAAEKSTSKRTSPPGTETSNGAKSRSTTPFLGPPGWVKSLGSREPSPTRDSTKSAKNTDNQRDRAGRGHMITPADAAAANTARADSREGSVSGAASPLPFDNDANGTTSVSLDDVVKGLRRALAGRIVRDVDKSEGEVESVLGDLQKRLDELRAIYAESTSVLSAFDFRKGTSKEEIRARIRSLEDAKQDFAMIEDLEQRVHQAQARIDDYKQRMAAVSALIDMQEKDNLLRKRRTFYTTWTTVLSLIVVVVAIVVVRSKWFGTCPWRPRPASPPGHSDLSDVLRELSGLHKQPIVTIG